MTESKNNKAWEKLFEKHRIINHLTKSDYFSISSDDINEVRESRLMTKFDHKSQLPKLFADNNLSILPVSRGKYIVGRFETFYDFNQEHIEIEKIAFPSYLESLDHKNITSEASAINCAFISGILHDFLGESNLYSTVNGRMSSSCFSFSVNSNKCLIKVDVDNSQIEIDGGYEGEYSLNLIEAKNYLSNDFLVRQLFYPYRLWTQKVSKNVRNIFLNYTNGVFHLREYIFTDSEYYNSLKLVRQKKYALHDGVINIETIQALLNTARIVDEPRIPFPQANSFDRVINLCELLKQKGTLTKEEITQNYDFDSRQTDYYSNACKYLELIDWSNDGNATYYHLTKQGDNLFDVSIFDRQIEFVKLILSHSVFNSSLKLYLETGNPPSKEEVTKVMRNSNLYKINSESTYMRRSSTILSWINWIINLVEG